MALVTITYNAWDASRQPIAASRMPEVWFRPLATSLAAGLITDRSVKGTLDASTGAGSVRLEAAPGVFYVPFMRWLIDAAVPDAHSYAEWPAIFTGKGGDISTLDPAVGIRGVVVGFGPPPGALEDAVYLDIRGPLIDVWGPKGGDI